MISLFWFDQSWQNIHLVTLHAFCGPFSAIRLLFFASACIISLLLCLDYCYTLLLQGNTGKAIDFYHKVSWF
jgi:hypothetical protein